MAGVLHINIKFRACACHSCLAHATPVVCLKAMVGMEMMAVIRQAAFSLGQLLVYYDIGLLLHVR